MKKKWEKPTLIVLTRSQPAESILTYCKADWFVDQFRGPQWSYNDCSSTTNCPGCDSYQAS